MHQSGPPMVIRAVVPLPAHARGLVEMPILHDTDPDHHCSTRCYRCKVVRHVVPQCPKKRRNRKCTICGGTHKPAKCPVKAHTASPEVVSQVFGEVVQQEQMSLLECIALLNHIEYSPLHCTECGCQNPEHLEMECPMYKLCIKCYIWGPRGFVKCHSCSTVSEISWEANADYYKEEWYQGCD